MFPADPHIMSVFLWHSRPRLSDTASSCSQHLSVRTHSHGLKISDVFYIITLLLTLTEVSNHCALYTFNWDLYYFRAIVVSDANRQGKPML